MNFLDREYAREKVYPERQNIFRAFELTPYEEVKVVIVGQDPYFRQGQADGLAFSVEPNVPIPPSLRNIYSELNYDMQHEPASTGNLTKWAKEGVLLLNSILTVREGTAKSHEYNGWEIFTDRVIAYLDYSPKPIVFILWGKYAQEKERNIRSYEHLVITSSHPSPNSAHTGFFGSRPFSKANKFLMEHGIAPVRWKL